MEVEWRPLAVGSFYDVCDFTAGMEVESKVTGKISRLSGYWEVRVNGFIRASGMDDTSQAARRQATYMGRVYVQGLNKENSHGI